MAYGDHLRVQRSSGYWHHGIDAGDRGVIHYGKDKWSPAVVITPVGRFSEGGDVEVVVHDHCDPPEVVVARAMSCLGERNYSVFFRNCEHFATWCKTGEGRSEQARNVAAVLGLGEAGLALSDSLLPGPVGLAAVSVGYRAYKLFRIAAGAAEIAPDAAPGGGPAILATSDATHRAVGGDFLCPRCGRSASVAWCGYCELAL